MLQIVKKLLRSQGGWMMAIPAAMSLASSIMGMVSSNKKAKGFNRSGEEKNLANWDQWLANNRMPAIEQVANDQRQGFIDPAIQAAKEGGLMPAISEAFSQRPNSAELDSIAAQERNLKNQALNTGARGGLLKQQMFEAAKNAASNKLNLMENARQNALQRAFQTFSGLAPSQASDINRGNQLLNYDTMQSNNMGLLAKLGVERNLAKAGVGAKEGEQAGGGLGSILGSLTSSMGNMLGQGIPGATGQMFNLPVNIMDSNAGV